MDAALTTAKQSQHNDVCCGDTGVTPGEIDLADYTRSIERLNTSLGFLQTEMQRLAQQQEKIMAMREQQQQAWVIPPPAPSPHRYHFEWQQRTFLLRLFPTRQLQRHDRSADSQRRSNTNTLPYVLSVPFTGSSVSCVAAA